MTEHFYPPWRTYASDAYNVMTNMTTYRSTGGPSAVSATTNAHHRFVYDGYLCIQRLNGSNNNSIELVFGWDPSEPVATRPLILQKYGQYNLFYTHDGNKNVSELVSYQSARGVAAHYEYAPFGEVVAQSRGNAWGSRDISALNPWRFSSEYADDALGLVYYNYRHYEPVFGRWLCKDVIEEYGGLLIYGFCSNMVLLKTDSLGLTTNLPIPGTPYWGRIELQGQLRQ